METELCFKVVIIGAVGVGKSSLAIRYVQNEFKEHLDSTLGAVYLERTTSIAGKKVKFEFWDTAGQERYKAIARIYYKDCKAAVVVYDVNSSSSFQELKNWVEELKANAPEDVQLAIVGNKIDLDAEQVPYEAAKTYAQQLGATLKYTSARDGKGVQELFQSLGQSLVSQHQNEKELRRSKLSSSGSKIKKEGKSNCC